MEIRDYSQFRDIVISKDLPIKFFNGTLVISSMAFEKLGIQTLEDLFIAYENGILNNEDLNYDLKGLTEMLLSYYTGTPLVADDILNKELVSANLENEINSHEIIVGLRRLGITYSERKILCEYCRQSYSKFGERTTIFEILQKLSNDGIFILSVASSRPFSGGISDFTSLQNLMFKIEFLKFYLAQDKAMLETRDLDSAEYDIISHLEDQQVFLYRTRQNLDKQIQILEEQLSNLYSNRGKGR